MEPFGPYKSLLIGISEELTSHDLETIIYGFNIPRGRAEDIKSGIRLLQYLEERGDLQQGKFDQLIKALETINRNDLVKKIQEHIRCHENNLGSASGDSGKVSSEPHSNGGAHFIEKEGYRVKVVEGYHFHHNNINYVRMKVDNKFHLELSNTNGHGSVVDVSLSKSHGERQEVIGVKLDAHQGNLTIYGSSISENFLCQDDLSTDGSLNQLQYLEITYATERSIVFFQTRKFNGNSCSHVLSEVMEVDIPKVSAIKVQHVIEKLKKKFPDIAGSCFYNGNKILQAHDQLFPLTDIFNKQYPLLLLKQTEQISVRQSHGDGGMTASSPGALSSPRGEVAAAMKYVEVNPSSNVEVIKRQICQLCSLDLRHSRVEFKVDGKEVQNSIDCLKGRFVEVTQIHQSVSSDAPSGFRNVSRRTRGTAQGFQPKYEFEDELCGVLTEPQVVWEGQSQVVSRSAKAKCDTDFPQARTKAANVLTAKGNTATSSGKTVATPADDKMVTSCPDDKVVITIYLVPTRSPPSL